METVVDVSNLVDHVVRWKSSQDHGEQMMCNLLQATCPCIGQECGFQCCMRHPFCQRMVVLIDRHFVVHNASSPPRVAVKLVWDMSPWAYTRIHLMSTAEVMKQLSDLRREPNYGSVCSCACTVLRKVATQAPQRRSETVACKNSRMIESQESWDRHQ